MLCDIRGLYRLLDEAPSESQYADLGRYSVSTVRQKFGTYTKGREAAGLPNTDKRGGQNRVPRADLLEALRQLDEEVKGSPTREQMRQQGGYSANPYRREFGGWTVALEAAGIEPNQSSEYIEFKCAYCGAQDRKLASSVTDQERIFCSKECLNSWRSEEFTGPDHPLWERVIVECETCSTSWERRPSVAESRDRHFCSPECFSQWCEDERVGENHPRWKGGGEYYYGPNFHSQRRKRLAVDNYRCQECGLTQEEHLEKYGQEPDVHHRTSVREFYNDVDYEAGETPNWEEMNALSNLLTVCRKCHRQLE
nr:hypothetical protein [Natrinema sp. CBA1119]